MLLCLMLNALLVTVFNPEDEGETRLQYVG
jgi:hypothetical protein